MGAIVVEEYRDLSAVGGLRAEWDALAKREGASPSHGFDWTAAVWEVHWQRRELVLLVARDGGELVGVAPLRVERAWRKGVPAKFLKPLTSSYSVHGTEFLLSRSHPGALAAFGEWLSASHPDWDLWVMYFVADDPQRKEFERLARRYGYRFTTQRTDRSPFLPLSGTWDEFLKCRPSKFRSDLKARERRLREKGRLDFRIVDGRGSRSETFAAIHEIENDSWKDGAGTSITKQTQQALFYERYADTDTARSDLRVALLCLDGEPVAYDYALFRDGIYFLLKTSYKERFRSDCPGVVLRKLVIERLFGEGAREIDFLGRDEPWKLKWTDRVREHVSYGVFNSRVTSWYLLGLHRLARRLGSSGLTAASPCRKDP